MTTRAPSRRKRSAIARPRPLVPPVMSAPLPSSKRMRASLVTRRGTPFYRPAPVATCSADSLAGYLSSPDSVAQAEKRLDVGYQRRQVLARLAQSVLHAVQSGAFDDSLLAQHPFA